MISGSCRTNSERDAVFEFENRLLLLADSGMSLRSAITTREDCVGRRG